MSMTGQRLQRSDLPSGPTWCPLTCIYKEEHTCSDPRTNKGNGDARCHHFGNKKLLNILQGKR